MPPGLSFSQLFLQAILQWIRDNVHVRASTNTGIQMLKLGRILRYAMKSNTQASKTAEQQASKRIRETRGS